MVNKVSDMRSTERKYRNAWQKDIECGEEGEMKREIRRDRQRERMRERAEYKKQHCKEEQKKETTVYSTSMKNKKN